MRICRPIDEPSFASRGGQITALMTRDARSDNAVRLVAVDRDCVSIERCFKGIHMNLAIPVAAYHGVAAIVAQDGTCQVHLVHRDPDLSIPLHEARDGREANAELHAWARLLGLPALDARDHDGVETIPFWPPHERATSLWKARRPSFLKRRKTGRAELATIVHRGDREIIARD
jgi:hypothetical protein